MVDGTGNVLLADIPDGQSQAQITSFRGHDPTLPEKPTAPHPPGFRDSGWPAGSLRARQRLPPHGSWPCKFLCPHKQTSQKAGSSAQGTCHLERQHHLEFGAGCWGKAWLQTPGRVPRPSLGLALSRFHSAPATPPSAPGGEHRACSGNALCAQWVSLWEQHQNSRRKDKKWKQPGVWSSPGRGQLRPGAAEALSQCPGCLGPLGVQGRACRQRQHCDPLCFSPKRPLSAGQCPAPSDVQKGL